MSIAEKEVPPYDLPRTRLTDKQATRPIEPSSRPYQLHFLTFTRDNKSCRKQQSAQQGGPHSVRPTQTASAEAACCQSGSAYNRQAASSGA